MIHIGLSCIIPLYIHSTYVGVMMHPPISLCGFQTANLTKVRK